MAISLGKPPHQVGFNDLPVVQEHGANFRLYNASTAMSAHENTFQIRLDKHGAYEGTSGRTADQYYTVVNVTSGTGYVGWILTGSNTNTAATVTVKCTIDGVAVERTIDPQGGTTYQRCLFGNTGVVATSYQDAEDLYVSYGRPYWEKNFDDDTHVYYGGWYIYLLPVQEMMKLGVPCMKFNKSLKVEIKESHAGNSDAYYRNHYVHYIITG